MEYISSDTNVWIDYMAIEKLELPFRLSVKYLMNEDAVNDELLAPNGFREKLLGLGLTPTALSEEEFYYAIEIQQKNQRLSGYDSAALAIAKFRGITLLTGDRRLRDVAEKEDVPVIGTIGLLDLLLEYESITSEEYQECISLLIDENGFKVRLPMSELLNRLEK